MKIVNCVVNFAYNIDRAFASLFGADPQATISSEVGRHAGHPLADQAAALLDAFDKGHVEDAQARAKLLAEAVMKQ
jgi:hypothetical protein